MTGVLAVGHAAVTLQSEWARRFGAPTSVHDGAATWSVSWDDAKGAGVAAAGAAADTWCP